MIYFIRDLLSGFVKIGHSGDPLARFSQIQCSNPGPVELLGVEDGDVVREAALHAEFGDARSRGEWFHPSAAILAHAATLGPPPVRKSATRAFWGGKTAKEVAFEVGISQPMLSHIRTGKRRPSPETAIRLQDATGISAIKLVFGELAERAA